jgi:hypothetical protein
MPYSQAPVAFTYSDDDKFSPVSSILFTLNPCNISRSPPLPKPRYFKGFISFNFSYCKLLWISFSTLRATWPAHLIIIYRYMYTLAFLIIIDMKMCKCVTEWCEETLDEQRYLPDTVRGALSINTLPSTGSCIGDFQNCVYKGKTHVRAPCWSDQQNVSHINL